MKDNLMKGEWIYGVAMMSPRLQYNHVEMEGSLYSKLKWLRDYEGNKTLRSFLTDECMNKIYIDNNEDYVKLEDKYTQFFHNLNYIHHKLINNQKFIFSHGNTKGIWKANQMIVIVRVVKYYNDNEHQWL